jgi:hypothetical protein
MEAFAFVAQLISTISVVVSLVYLAFKIRQNTRAVRRAAARDILRDLNELGRYFIELPDLDELYLRALERPQELTVAERFRFQRLITYIFSSFQMALEYHTDGLLSDEDYEAYAQGILQLFESSVVMEWWETEGRFVFGQRFRDLVSERGAASVR